MWLSDIIVSISDVMGRFVPMGILSDKTTDVGRGIFAFQPGIQLSLIHI
mgnify:CR=1 FL=1